MNAVISLCHFCEVHGPKILFSSQPFHEEPEERFGAGSPDSGNGSVVGGLQSYPAKKEPKKRFYGSYEMLLRDERRLDSDGPSVSSSSTENCDSCQSVSGSLPGFLTNDDNARISYVTSRYPYHPEIFSMVRKACLRSLSCEVSPEAEGPIFFGDEELHGYTLCHTFTLRDAKARGFQHFYAILIVSIDKLLLLNSYDFLLKCLETLINRLKAKANHVFDTEQQIGTLRLATAGRASMLPTGFLRQRAGSGGSSRSLTELTGDTNIFRFLHRYFVWILKAQTLRTVELVLEGCPTQDTLVRLEQEEEERSEEFESDLSGFVSLAPIDLNGDPKQVKFYAEAQQELETDDSHFNDYSIESIEIWNPYSDLQMLASQLGRDNFRVLLYRLIIGDQIVIRGEHAASVRRIIDCLTCLIPRGCAKIVYWSSEYVETFVCNLLGINAGASCQALAEHVRDGDRNFVFLSLLSIASSAVQCMPCPSHSFPDKGAVDESTRTYNKLESAPLRGSDRAGWMGRYRFKLQTGAALPNKLPKLLSRIELLLFEEEKLRPNVLEQVLNATREEWLNKSKVFYQYCKQHSSPSEENFQKLMRIMRIVEADQDVVKFWQAGLSKQYKAYVLNACARLKQQANRTTDKREKD